MQNDKEKFKKEFIKRLVKFSVLIIKFSQKAKNQKLPWCVFDQLIRSATSVGANIVEARASSSKKDYIKFFEISLKSANETIYWLIVIRETFPELKDKAEGLRKEANEIAKIIGSSVLTLKGKK